MTSYIIIDFPKHGKYISSSPLSAAKKAFSKLSEYYNMKNNSLLVFSIMNVKTKKIYKYIGTKIELYKPIVINKFGKNIVYKYKNIVTKYFSEIDY